MEMQQQETQTAVTGMDVSQTFRWSGGLLGDHEPDAVQVEGNPQSQFVITCDHGGNRVPERLGNLGLPQKELSRHIGWDIGALGVARHLVRLLDGMLIHQPYSRLVIDCNRPPHVPEAFPQRSDGTDIPGNTDMSAADAAARVAEIFLPYHRAIASALDARTEQDVVLLAMHTYTPEHGDYPDARPWPISFLFNRDARLSQRLGRTLRASGINVGMNQPYLVDDVGDYAIPVHAETRNILSTLIEVRQDLVEHDEGQREWAQMIAQGMRDAIKQEALQDE